MNQSEINKIVVYPIFVTVIVFMLSASYMYWTHPKDDTNPINMNDVLIKSVILSSLFGLMTAGYIHMTTSQTKKMRFRLK